MYAVILAILLMSWPALGSERDSEGSLTLTKQEATELAAEIAALREANDELYQAWRAAQKKLTTCKDVTKI